MMKSINKKTIDKCAEDFVSFDMFMQKQFKKYLDHKNCKSLYDSIMKYVIYPHVEFAIDIHNMTNNNYNYNIYEFNRDNFFKILTNLRIFNSLIEYSGANAFVLYYGLNFDCKFASHKVSLLEDITGKSFGSVFIGFANDYSHYHQEYIRSWSRHEYSRCVNQEDSIIAPYLLKDNRESNASDIVMQRNIDDIDFNKTKNKI